MSKLGRNEPCPCGSGQKYKKCCIKKQVQPATLDSSAQQQLQQFLPKLLDFSKTFDRELQPLYDRYTATYRNLHESDARAFSQILFHWLIFNANIFEDDRTVVQRFIEQERSHYADNVIEIIERWGQVAPTLYLVEKQGETASLKDCFNNFIVVPEQTDALNKLDAGDFLFGYVYPTATGVVLGTDSLLIPEKYVSLCLHEYGELYRNYKEGEETEQSFVTRNFPTIIGILVYILEQKDNTIHKTNKSAKNVYEVFYKNSSLEDYPSNTILTAKNNWLTYYEKTEPKIQKPEVFAAVLEYWVSKQENQWTNISQKSLGEKYGVSPATISSRYKELEGEFNTSRKV
ncbi:YecA family protein [Evansella sp. AB-rgal1]|uniref:YecA family protein n=1 Tax=Evansella sp. AB-rgal1 TaxID=3242696 RepID=UPI00359D6609